MEVDTENFKTEPDNPSKLKCKLGILTRPDGSALFCEENSANKIKTTWDTIITNIQKKPSKLKENLELEIDIRKITGPTQVANHFAQFYQTIAQKLTEKIKSKKTHTEFLKNVKVNLNRPFSFKEVPEKEVVRITKKLLSKPSSGYDEIPITVIKNTINILRKPITYLINLSLKSDHKEHPLTIFCNLSKAFDCVDHNILLEKLEFYGITNNWFFSYIHGWQIFVEVGQNVNNNLEQIQSTLRPLTCGVTQGSILGPLLFLLYVNDLEINFPSALFTLFADDTSITLREKLLNDLQTEGKQLLDEINDWFAANKLVLNVDRTFNMLFQPNKKIGELNIATENGSVTSQQHLKFLGVYIDNALNWKNHTSSLNKSLSSAIYAIRTAKQNIGREVAMTVYYAYFYSLLQYGVEFWGISVGAKDTFLLQKRAIRAIFSLGRLQSCRAYFKDNKIFTLTNLYIYRTAILMFNERENLTMHSDIHTYFTRGNGAFLPPNFTLEVNRRGPSYMGIKILNNLPRESAVIAAIYGPVEVKTQRILMEKAVIECYYRPKAGLPGVQDRFRESIIKNICETALAASLYPRAAIVLNLQEMQNRGQLISSAINATCLACLDSGIDMKFIFAAVSCFLTQTEEFSFIPPINENNSRGMFVFVFNNTSGSILASHTEGCFSVEQYRRALSLCREESKNIFGFIKTALLAVDKLQ
ncbi:unnamed protein product [Ceutorhynchus assimilis]|uniref:Reverse transcriptase domain-containing protein n=1 Tax=Ceutorhynchus assimilis TaxID=467358 RepID=A0A9N9MKF7_9CUCU|nr:unnamed protein product [Ceutorhynchus assimilis]